MEVLETTLFDAFLYKINRNLLKIEIYNKKLRICKNRTVVLLSLGTVLYIM